MGYADRWIDQADTPPLWGAQRDAPQPRGAAVLLADAPSGFGAGLTDPVNDAAFMTQEPRYGFPRMLSHNLVVRRNHRHADVYGVRPHTGAPCRNEESPRG